MDHIMSDYIEYEKYSGKKYIGRTYSTTYDIREEPDFQDVFTLFPQIGICIKINSIEMWNAMEFLAKNYTCNNNMYYSKCFDKMLKEFIKRYISENPDKLHNISEKCYDYTITHQINFSIDKFGDKDDPENIDLIIMSR